MKTIINFLVFVFVVSLFLGSSTFVFAKTASKNVVQVKSSPKVTTSVSTKNVVKNIVKKKPVVKIPVRKNNIVKPIIKIPQPVVNVVVPVTPVIVEQPATESTNVSNSANLSLARVEADWILTAQKPSGAVGMTPDSPHIMPYFANLALTPVIKLSADYQGAVQKYMMWYFDHINRTPDDIGVVGTIYDYYQLPDGTEVTEKERDATKKNYDSSDSYAATFLSLANAYYQTTGDSVFIKNHLADLKLISSAIDATLQPIGLTYAKKDYHALYLMDNVEVWRGYQDFSELLASLKDPEAGLYFQKAENIRTAIEKNLWNEEKQEYTPYYGHTMNWNVFYADASANLWPVIFDLPEAQGERAVILWNKFLSAQPSWVNQTVDSFPWMSLALGAVKAKDGVVLKTYLDNNEAKFFPARKWPWYIAESGWYMRVLMAQ